MQPPEISQQCCYVISCSGEKFPQHNSHNCCAFVPEWNEKSCSTHHSSTSAMLRHISLLFHSKSPKPPWKSVRNPSTNNKNESSSISWANTAKAELCSENSSQTESSMIMTGKMNSQTTDGLILTLNIVSWLWKYASFGMRHQTTQELWWSYILGQKHKSLTQYFMEYIILEKRIPPLPPT